MVTNQDIIDEARTWIGTPFHHQAAIKNIGCDCIGLMRGVYEQLFPGILENDPNYRKPTYSKQPFNSMFPKSLEDTGYVTIIEKGLKSGYLLLFAYRKEPQHIGIFTEKGTIIHAGNPKVVEHRLDDKWRKRIRVIYSINGVEYV